MPDDDAEAAPLSRDRLARAQVAARTADDKSATNVVALDVGDILGIAEAFVIASASNVRQVRTVVDEIERVLKEDGDGSISVEGLDDASWVLLDFGDVIVHVFLEETRAYYDLDRLWADAPGVEWQTAAVECTVAET